MAIVHLSDRVKMTGIETSDLTQQLKDQLRGKNRFVGGTFSDQGLLGLSRAVGFTLLRVQEAGGCYCCLLGVVLITYSYFLEHKLAKK